MPHLLLRRPPLWPLQRPPSLLAPAHERPAHSLGRLCLLARLRQITDDLDWNLSRRGSPSQAQLADRTIGTDVARHGITNGGGAAMVCIYIDLFKPHVCLHSDLSSSSQPAGTQLMCRCSVRSVHVACVACGGAGGVCEASSEVYERVRVCTDRKGGWGSGTYQPTSAVTPQQPWHQLSLLAPKRGTLDRLYN